MVSIYFIYFHKFTKIILQSFECPKSMRNYIKKIMLGISETWSMSHLSYQTSEPGYHIVDCRISKLQQQTHSKVMTGNGQLTRDAFIINDFLRNSHFNWISFFSVKLELVLFYALVDLMKTPII